jgi:hypothetical protein
MEVNRYDIIEMFGRKQGEYISSLLYRIAGGIDKTISCASGGNRYVRNVVSTRNIIHYNLDSAIEKLTSHTELRKEDTRSKSYVNAYLKVIDDLRKMKDIINEVR